MKPFEPAVAEAWRARLSLVYGDEGGQTRLRSRSHEGPLVVQRPLYPEGRGLCQTIVVHPPGGIAGGDALELSVRVGSHARVQLTTPGATKWYRGFGHAASQSVRFEVERSGLCEWLPQENIVFDGADAGLALEVELDESAVWCGWEFVCLGRPESGAPFETGRLKQRTVVRAARQTVFREQGCLEVAARWLSAPAVLGGRCAYATLIVAGRAAPQPILRRAREILEGCPTAGVTAMGHVLVARWVGDRIEEGRSLFVSLWAALRPWYAQRMAIVPRIWMT
jgi:urease accessory protein